MRWVPLPAELAEVNLRRLHYFVAVAEELHFGRAADRLDMAQPPLSQQIRTLENELGLRLFQRNTRRVALTDAGRELLPHARSMLRGADELRRTMDGVRDGRAGILRLGFVDSASYGMLPPFLREHRDAAPGVRHVLRSMSSDAQRAALLDGELDLGITRTPGAVADLEVVMLATEPLVLAVADDHPLASAGRIDLEEVAGSSFIGFDRSASPTLFAEVASLFARRGMVYDPVLEAGEYTTVLGLVAAGLGVALAPASVRTFAPRGLGYLTVRDDDAVARLMLLHRPGPRPIVSTAIEVARRSVVSARP